MKLELEFAELHTPLFLGGKNFGLKLHSVKPGDPELIYDQSEKELHVTHNKKMAIIPISNVVSMTPSQGPRIEPVKKEFTAPKKIKAQVSTPMDHVFAGEGAGKTHD
jgi:hypothetical protein